MAKFFTSSYQGSLDASGNIDPATAEKQTIVLPNVVGFAEIKNTNPPEDISGAQINVWTNNFDMVSLRTDPPNADAQRFKDEWTIYLNNQSVFNKRRVYFPAPQYITDMFWVTGWTFLVKEVSNYHIGNDDMGQYCSVSTPMWPLNLQTYYQETSYGIETYDATAIQTFKDLLNEIYT